MDKKILLNKMFYIANDLDNAGLFKEADAVTVMMKKIADGESLKNYEYLFHHVEINDDEEELHHCYFYDHLGNMFEQEHLVVKDGKAFINDKEAENGVYHIIKGLEPDQEVAWSDEVAIENKIKPKKMSGGMTFKEKAKEW